MFLFKMDTTEEIRVKVVAECEISKKSCKEGLKDENE